jgi:type IV pilus assembly protein PilM
MSAWDSRHPIAVDLSDGACAAALQMAPRRGGLGVRAGLARVAAPGAAAGLSDNDRLAFLREALRHPGFSGRAVAMLPPMDAVLCYPLRVTTGKDEILEAAIVREAGDVLPMPIEEAVVDYVSVMPDPSGEKRTHLVLLAAIRKADVERYGQMVHQAGGVLEAIEPVASSLLRTHGSHAALASKPAMLCHIGKARTLVAVATRDGVAACRSFAWGTDNLRAKLVGNLDLPGKQRDADHLLRKHGVRYAVLAEGDGGATDAEARHSSTVAQLLVPLVDELAHELHTVAGYVRASASGTALGDSFLYGDGTRVCGLDGYLARELNVDVTAVEPKELTSLSEVEAGAESAGGVSYALAFGLGLRRVRWL